MPLIKRTGGAGTRRKFRREPLRGTEILFCGRGFKLFPLLRVTNCKHIISCYILFRLNTLKGTAKPPPVDLLKLNILRGTKTSFLTPKRSDEQPRPFYMEILPTPHPPPSFRPRALNRRGLRVYIRSFLTPSRKKERR